MEAILSQIKRRKRRILLFFFPNSVSRLNFTGYKKAPISLHKPGNKYIAQPLKNPKIKVLHNGSSVIQ